MGGNNPLSKYIGNTKLIESLDSIEVVQRTSKDGNPYCAIDLKFVNGYTKTIFAFRSEEQFAFANAFEFVLNS